MDDQPGPLYVAPQTRPARDDRDPHPFVPEPDEIEHQPDRSDRVPPPLAPPPHSRWRRILGWLLVLALLAAGAAWFVYRGAPKAPPTGRFQSSGPMPVGTSPVQKGDMPVYLTGLGTVTPLANVTVKTQINGQLTEVAFQEGQAVKKGDFLAQIDPRPYQVALGQAEGQLAKDQAALKNAQVDLARYRTLVAQNSIARQTLDTQAALVQQDQGVIQADQAQVDAQRLNLTYCRIVSPISGRVGLRQVDPGNYVQTGDANGIVVIAQIQPISAIFTLPEDNLPTLMRRMKTGPLPVTAFDRTGVNKLDSGRLVTVDNQIDPTTGTVKLRAVFDNPDQILFPNQFVNIQLLVDTLHDAAIVPVAAIQRGAPGTFVYVVKPDSTVMAQAVTLGPTDNQRVAITKGLEAGQVVVTDGADRLKEGAKVTVAKAPSDRAGPGQEGAAAGDGQNPPASPSDGQAQQNSSPSDQTGEQQRGQGGQRRQRNSQ